MKVQGVATSVNSASTTCSGGGQPGDRGVGHARVDLIREYQPGESWPSADELDPLQGECSMGAEDRGVLRLEGVPDEWQVEVVIAGQTVLEPWVVD